MAQSNAPSHSARRLGNITVVVRWQAFRAYGLRTKRDSKHQAQQEFRFPRSDPSQNQKGTHNFVPIRLSLVIIVRSPLRVSVGGGGTDLPSYYRKHTGFVAAAANIRNSMKLRPSTKSNIPSSAKP